MERKRKYGYIYLEKINGKPQLFVGVREADRKRVTGNGVTKFVYLTNLLSST